MPNKTIKKLEVLGLIGDAEGRFKLFIPEQTGIYVPPDVEAISEPLTAGNSFNLPNDTLKSLILHFPPIPDNPHIYNNRNHLLYWLQQNGWEKAEGTNIEKMFNKFLKLSEGSPYHPNTIERIKEFALRYGPLWEGGYYPQGRKPAYYKRGNWYGYENVPQWYEKAKELDAAFEVAMCLLENKKASEEKWLHLKYEDASEYEIEMQRQLLCGIINTKLKQYVTLQTMWEKNGFKVHIDTGLGFLGTLWLNIAQILTKKLMLCICDGCGRPYIRTGRKPQKGRRNFCGDCGHGDKASKRLWRQENKGGDK